MASDPPLHDESTASAAERAPVEHRARVNGVELAYFEWGRPSDAPTIFLVHATGFHARVWDDMISRLGDRHVLSVDQRGHGRSEKTAIEHWDVMGRDLVALVDHLGLRGAIGVGHSMGGHALPEAAAERPDAFERLVLIDPVIASPDDYGTSGWRIDPGGEPHPTARRKNHFDSPDAMIARFAGRPPYSVFTPRALADYCRFGLLPDPEGEGFVLACPPAIEASIYMTSRTNPGVYDSVRRVEVPVTVLRAKLPPPDRDMMDFSSSPTWPGLAAEFPNGRDVHLSRHTHFLPMEVPALIARFVLDRDAVP